MTNEIKVSTQSKRLLLKLFEVLSDIRNKFLFARSYAVFFIYMQQCKIYTISECKQKEISDYLKI